MVRKIYQEMQNNMINQNKKIMKKLNFVLICIVSMAIITACGGKKEKSETGNEAIDQKIEKVEKCEATWAKRYNGKLTLADVQPDFEFTEVEKGFDCFSGNGVNNAKAVYKKKDGSMISEEEWKAYVTKIYNVTKKLAQDGKVVRGFGNDLDVKTRDQALEERTLEKALSQGENLQWGFLMDDRFEACYLSWNNNEKNSYIAVTFGEGVQKNLDEALKEAEEFLNKK